MMGGGSPAGGRQGRTNDCPSCAMIGFILSLDHSGDPAGNTTGSLQHVAVITRYNREDDTEVMMQENEAESEI